MFSAKFLSTAWAAALARAACLGLIVGCCTVAAGQPTPLDEPVAPPAPGTELLPAEVAYRELTPELIAERRKQLEAVEGLDEAQRAALAASYDLAEANLASAAELAKQREQYKSRIDSAAVAVADLEQQLATALASERINLPDGATTAELESLLSKNQAELEETRESLAKLEGEQQRRNARKAELPRSIAALKREIAEQRNQLAVLPPTASADAAQLAQRTAMVSEVQKLTTRLEAEEREGPAYDATARQLELQRDLTARQLATLEKQVAAVRAEAERRRAADAAKQVEEARRQIEQQYPSLEIYVKENLKLAEQRQELTSAMKRDRDTLEESLARFEALRRSVSNVRAKIDALGLNESTGLALRNQRSELPDPAELLEGAAERQNHIREIHESIINLRERRTKFADFEAYVDQLVIDMGISGEGGDGHAARESARRIARQEADLVDALLSDYNSYFNDLVELDEVRRQHAELVQQQIDYIDERTLWIRSNFPLTLGDFSRAAASLADMFSWRKITSVVATLIESVRSRPLLSCFAVIVIGLGLYFSRRLRVQLRKIGATVTESRMAPMKRTGEAIIITLAIALIWPALIGFVGVSIQQSSFAGDHAQAVGAALFRLGVLLVPLELLRHILRPQGLAMAHFHWPEAVCQRGRRAAQFLLLFTAPLSFLVILSAETNGPSSDDPLGRIAYILIMLLIALAAWRFMGPGSPVLRWFRASINDAWAVRTVPVVAAVLIAAPLLLGTAAALGYYYTATKLTWKFTQSVWLLIGLLMVSGAVMRWLVIARTRLARSRVRELREQTVPAGVSQEVANDSLDDLNLDTSTVSAQSKQLLHLALLLGLLTGLWMIWSDVAPALRKLDQIQIIAAAEPAADSASADSTSSGDAGSNGNAVLPAPITMPSAGNSNEAGRADGLSLADLGLAFLAALLFIALLRNLPGTLELLVLQRLPMDAGGRFAVTAIVRYVLIMLGIMIVAGFLGIRWSNVQWLVAAITLGLGFGLQEIFANFVSGIILLLERPMRIGDVVTVGDVSGVVSRIQMRATTITNFERQELVVPNKEFVTGRLLNWTLSNSVNRITLTVGIAYGSDTKLADETLHKVIESHPEVMNDPPPLITFELFGDSTLNFVCRIYLPSLDNRLQTIHELHMQIDQAFRDAGIEIAFPQRDLHIRTIDGKSARLPISTSNGDLPNPSERVEQGDAKL
ncbi:MAG: mechanosensitive ion channel domain-containing protein [Pirellulales bacterium]